MNSTTNLRRRQQQLPPQLQYTKELPLPEQAERALFDAVDCVKCAVVNGKRLASYITGQSGFLEWKPGPSGQRRDAREARRLPRTHGEFLHQEQRAVQEQEQLLKAHTFGHELMHQGLAKAQAKGKALKLEQYTELIEAALGELLGAKTISAEQADLLRARELNPTAWASDGTDAMAPVPHLNTGSQEGDRALVLQVQAHIGKNYLASDFAHAELAKAKAKAGRHRLTDSDDV